jgi:hypothetical protein
MSKALKMCYDRLLPNDLRRVQRVRSYAPGPSRALRPRAISLIGKQWVNGSTISIRFMGGTQSQKDMVKAIAPEWTKHANLDFEFTDSPNALIRVTFDADDGAWSYVGTDNLNIPLHAATLNLGWQDEGVILHEFGHMIGLSHEHQNPEGGIKWNEQKVIEALAGPPNFWDEATVRHNVLDKYSADQLHGTAFDPASIMLYAFPAEWTTDGFATHENEKLSHLDKDFIKSEKMYPKAGAPEPTVTELAVSPALAASIGAPGEIDTFTFKVTKPGLHTVQTIGPTDVVMSLLGPDSQTRKVAEDDDSGAGHNAQIAADLAAGAYFVQVRHFNEQNVGDYHILVTR